MSGRGVRQYVTTFIPQCDLLRESDSRSVHGNHIDNCGVGKASGVGCCRVLSCRYRTAVQGTPRDVTWGLLNSKSTPPLHHYMPARIGDESVSSTVQSTRDRRPSEP